MKPPAIGVHRKAMEAAVVRALPGFKYQEAGNAMQLICLDFETYFADDYTLQTMTAEAYIRDPRFEALGCGIKAAGGTPGWVPQESLKRCFASIDWADTAVIAHHAQFDGLVLSHHYGVKPAFWFDTLSMARLIHGNNISVSLAALAKHYGLPTKTVPYDLFRGKRWQDCNSDTREQLARGCEHDVDLTWEIFGKLVSVFPPGEFPIVDMTVRMFTEPVLVGDATLFAKCRDDASRAKQEQLYSLGVSTKDLGSDAKFTALLEAEGVEVETKVTPKGNEKPAIAKTDRFMLELLENDNERVAALAQARLDVRSTIAETRAGRLYEMCGRGPLCVYLSYAGAHTTRWAGGDKVNFQNLPRSGDIRRGVVAPAGYLFGRVDQSQGECRLVNWLAGQDDVVARFRQGHDPYLPMASAFYGREITKNDKAERDLGKVLELQCGFGSGADKIKSSCRVRGIILTDAEALHGRNTYRVTHSQVTNCWKVGDAMLARLSRKESIPCAWGPCTVQDGKIFLPNDTWLDFASLHWHRDEATGDNYWRLETRHGFVKYYGAKLVENVVQALSRVVTSDAMLRAQAAGYRIVGMTHDDIWVLIPETTVGECSRALVECMTTPPAWGPDLPLAADCTVGKTYG